MGTRRDAEIDAWLRQGGVVVAASERAARAAMQGYHQARRAEGLNAWTAPRILNWQSFVRNEWEGRSLDGRLVLNPAQELALWRTAMQEERFSGSLLPSSSRRLAAMAMGAHALLAMHAPHFMVSSKRSNWQFDAAEFSRWLTRFEEICREQQVVSSHRIACELSDMLKRQQEYRPPLLLVGFDRVPAAQRAVFEEWGEARQIQTPAHLERQPLFYAARDVRAELTACAWWAGRKLAEMPSQRLLVIASDVMQLRGQIERAFLDAGLGEDIEFSLGIPLSSTGVVRSAILTLEFLSGSLSEPELDWLISTGYVAQSPASTSALQRTMRKIRRAGRERAEWTIDALCRSAERYGTPVEWCNRMLQAHRLLVEQSGRRSPVAWAALTTRVLEAAEWPGGAGLSSAEYQALDGFQRQVEVCASLGFDGSHLTWSTFLRELSQLAAEAVFSPESQDKRILIAGPAESAGLEADAIWFLGASEEKWPARGETHPFLPVHVQRDAGMPHASADLDWQLARQVTMRLTSSAPEICFSYARQVEGIENRPSRVLHDLAAAPDNLPEELQETSRLAMSVERLEDVDAVPLSVAPADFPVDSATISAQSQCPFKAFATTRLAAKGWDGASVGLSPATRGKLLHDVLANVWAGPPAGIRTAADLRAISDLRSFVATHAKAAMERLPGEVRSIMPEPHLHLEERRLVRLVSAWLDYEREREDFAVEAVEQKVSTTIAGLSLNLRLDRIDRLNDDSVLVVDYKTGHLTPRAWSLPRPEDLQLPLYAEFGLKDEMAVGGIAFARLKTGDLCLSGCVKEPEKNIGTVENAASLRRNKLTQQMLSDWRDTIEQLAHDFIAGRAFVDPRQPGKTCEHCGLQTVCRINEQDTESNEENA